MQRQRKLPPPQEEAPQSRLCASAEQPFPVSVFSLYRRQEHRATGTRKFFLAISPCIWYSVSVSICRCVGIGRRGGLKIHWANPPCGFDPRHRHQTNIIRTRSSLWETGSDYLFSLATSMEPISETVSSNDQNQNPEDQEKRNSFRRTLLWIRM